MGYSWFAQVRDILAARGVDRLKCGLPEIHEIRLCWLAGLSPDECAARVEDIYNKKK